MRFDVVILCQFLLLLLLTGACHFYETKGTQKKDVVHTIVIAEKIAVNWNVESSMIVEDSLYNALKTDFNSHITKLIEAIKDTTVIIESKLCAGLVSLRIGDISYCLLAQVLNFSEEQFLGEDRGRNCVHLPECKSPLESTYKQLNRNRNEFYATAKRLYAYKTN